jgi:hypothetical protein
MAPPKAGESTLKTKKPCTEHLIKNPEETLRVEASNPINFPRAYVPPRNPTTKQVRFHEESKYDLVILLMPHGVTIEGDMLGAVGNLMF